MTIARSIENLWINWSSYSVWDWYVYNWVSNDLIRWCNATWLNTENRANATKTWEWNDEWCNIKRKQRLYNWQYIWDFSWNVFEHVNKSNTYDWSLYNNWKTSIVWASNPTYYTWSDTILNPVDDMSSYFSVNTTYWISNWMWWVMHYAWIDNNIFVRWWNAENGNNSGIYTLVLHRGEWNQTRPIWFRCVTF